MSQLPHALETLGLDRRFSVDVLSVARGVRRLGLLHAPLSSESGLRAILFGAGLAVFARRELFRQNDPDSREGILRDPSWGESANFIELWYAQREDITLPPAEALFADPGTHLGYPMCCVAKWEKVNSQRDLYQQYIFETVGGLWELNRLAALFESGLLIPDFFPCSLSCKSAHAFVAPIVELVSKTLDPSWIANTARWMRAPLLERNGLLYAFPTWNLNGRDLELHAADAARTALAAVGRFNFEVRQGCRMVSFNHLIGAERVYMITEDGTRAAVPFDGMTL